MSAAGKSVFPAASKYFIAVFDLLWPNKRPA